MPDEEEIQTEASYSPKPLFYAQATKKLTASQLSRPFNGQSGTGQDVPLKKVDPVKEDYVPIRSTQANYGVRIVAEKISRDQPVQVVNAEPFVQMPVLAHDPMEKTDFYATQRIYTASAESPSDYIPTSNPLVYAQDQNPYVTSTYAYIEEAGISAEYQKEIAAAQKEAQSLSNTYRTDEAQSQTEIPDLSQEDVSFPTVLTVFTKASGDDLTKAKSAKDVSSEVTSVPVTESAYQEKTESREVETFTSTTKPAEEVSSEIAYAAVTQSTYQENSKAISNEGEFITTTKAQSAEDVSSEVNYPTVTEVVYQERTKILSYESPVVTTVKSQSAEDASLEVVDSVTESNDQDEATNITDTPWTRYRIPVVNQEPVEAVTAPYDATQLFTTPDVDTTSFVVGTIFQVDSGESQEAVTSSKTDYQLITTTPSRIQNTTYIAPPPPCHADKSSEVVSSPKFLFNTAALANLPLDSSESSGEDTTPLPATSGIAEVTTPSLASNESTERTTVASDSYKYTFKSRPTPHRYYETKTTTALPSINSTSTAQPSSRRPLVVIGKPVEIRKPINGRVYSRPSSMSQRKPQTLAQIKILPTRLRSSTSTIHLPNRRFFIGRSLMASEKGNRESKEDDEEKAK